ncbi:MAG TPA: hypothetical protein VNM90_10450 [Haliangium sp.]|nr:hypothetical protein [Haliangium sp.]
MAAWHRFAALLAWTIACTGACSTASSSARPEVTYSAAEGVTHTPAARSPEGVEIRALGAPARAHVIVGRLVVRADDDDRIERDRLMQVLRSRAAELGCDAVLLEPPFDEKQRVRFRYDYLTMTRPVLNGACIVYE